MAGKRRGTSTPLVRTARPERRRAALNIRLAQAHDPKQRVALAAEYLRSALAIHPDHTTAETAVTHLIETADRLFRGKEQQQ
ncbi:hypothetical protein BJF79_03425 [Actinomadura sp. CNU-125]|uniref:hypothetical protein n=1 Tax=Actinomadura sp. CNU-125 TaxID=1904961 RepID=UPI0009602CE9|nr:hypothetical protein [Actinomadura sp. CNU-125]OLT12964.1 hypothetical protein BJF79_03425 [Actinomadura sp. CNU-125]